MNDEIYQPIFEELTNKKTGWYHLDPSDREYQNW